VSLRIQGLDREAAGGPPFWVSSRSAEAQGPESRATVSRRFEVVLHTSQTGCERRGPRQCSFFLCFFRPSATRSKSSAALKERASFSRRQTADRQFSAAAEMWSSFGWRRAKGLLEMVCLVRRFARKGPGKSAPLTSIP